MTNFQIVRPPNVDTTECRFCAVARGKVTHASDKPLVQTNSYFVVPSIGSLVPGWVLICTNEHRTNFSSKYLDNELIELRIQVARSLKNTFGGPVHMFEHGAVAVGSRTGCGVDHAHLHLLAIDADLLEHQPATPGLTWQEVRTSSLNTATRGEEYLFYSNDPFAKDPRGCLGFPEMPISQFFRRAVATALNRSLEYDYRTHPHLENTLSTSSALRLA